MIRCPKCGTMNRDDNLLCKQCGTTLPQTRIWCPQCGAANPVGNVLCDNCNARLVTAEEGLPATRAPAEEAPAGVKGISLPTVPIAEDGTLKPAELPDWLAELTGEAVEQPTAVSTDDELAAAELPDWLSGLMDENLGSTEAATTGAGQGELSSAEVPDWLSDFGALATEAVDDAPSDIMPEGVPDAASAEGVAPAELPDWFSGLTDAQQEPDTVTEAATPEAELPDWMADFAESAAVTPSSEPATEETAATPDWLSGIMGEAVESTEEEEAPAPSVLPDWLSSLPEVETGAPEVTSTDWPPGESPVDATPELPDWLSAGSDQLPVSGTRAPRELPSWLAATTDATLPVKEAGEKVIPDWLNVDYGISPIPSSQPGDIQTGLPPERAETHIDSGADVEYSLEPETPVQDNVPDWLARLDIVEPEADSPEPSEAVSPDWLSGTLAEAPSASQIETPSAEQELPDWLAGLAPLESEAAVPEPELAAAKIPDWLSDALGDEGEPASAQPEPSSEEEELPDWLSELALSEPQAADTKSEPALEETPEWLSRAFVEDTVPVPAKTEMPPEKAKLPDWLADVEPTTPFETTADKEILPDRGLADSSPTFEGETVVQEETETLPDWLSGLDKTTESASTIFAEAEPEEVPGAEGLAKANLPAWLQDVPTVSDETAPKPTSPAFVSEDATDKDDLLGEDIATKEGPLEGETMPEWLQDLKPVSEEQPSLVEEMIDDDESLARAKVPAWVQNLRPPGTGPLPALPETADAVPSALAGEEGGLARAEIPDWLQQLRPSPTAKGGVPADGGVLIEPVEVEGPLSGLSGVLPAGLAVDMPTDYKGAPQPVIPESIVAQAQLWQELLEQPRSVERPVAQRRLRSGDGETATRLIVGLVLVVVTVFGLWLGEPRWSQALRKPHVESLNAAIEALQPGDRVVVAVEYGPAEAGEMTPMAEALLVHLADKQVEVMAISTLPDGSGLAQSLLTSVSVKNQLSESRSSYLSGDSNGIALFLGERLENVDMLLVLSARAERLRWWVELNNASTPGVADGPQPIPMGIGVSAAVGPLVSPYLNSPQIEGWLVGLPDVVAYREFRGLTSNFFNSTLDALMFAHWAALGLMIFGFIYYLASGRKGSM